MLQKEPFPAAAPMLIA